MSRLRASVTGLAVAAVTTGCGFHGVYSLPLPGAAAKGANTYTVRVQMADVLDLVPYSAVKVNAATVGHVKSIAVEGRHAVVLCQLPDSVKLPANAIARVEQTSVLGEKFVEIEPPKDVPPIGRLANGDVISLPHTDTDATVEEVLGALSMLLNGGGVDQLHTIT
ncbi:MAG TPA: MlaD family protein, partial [Mycobacteriales bacterium]|nr:MlaD family protein [Mycobacteriales bacterium]